MTKEKEKALEYEISQLALLVSQLEQRIVVLETGEKNTGVYFGGAPDYVLDYINENRKKKD